MSKRIVTAVGSGVTFETDIRRENVTFYDVRYPPFAVYGVSYDNGKFRRLPENVARAVSEGVHHLHAHTAGGRVRFRTDSSYIGLRAVMPSSDEFSFFAQSGSSGFDLYVYDDDLKRDSFFDNLAPPYVGCRGGFEKELDLGGREMREITVNLPLFSEISELYIILDSDAALEKPKGYRYTAPIVYYGSSITQGACATRPGCTYESIISRRLDADFINLGFAGCAKGEAAIGEYIASLDMSGFVLDYDHNSPTPEYLRGTHYKMYQWVRRAHPSLPIVMMSRPKKYHLRPDEVERLEIISESYRRAISAGDRNVYFITGDRLMALAGDDGLVDVCHPTDFGFASMAKCLGDLLEKIFDNIG
ncbi:MAG: hypothetical protein IKM46_01285 [Clostridia bacterium]|nr:hypothetical protein [Clostridia bacterium]